MNIYLVSQDFNSDYDTFDSFVCYAETEDQARNFHPSGEDLKGIKYGSDWVTDTKYVNVELKGTSEKAEPGVILASFNAG